MTRRGNLGSRGTRSGWYGAKGHAPLDEAWVRSEQTAKAVSTVTELDRRAESAHGGVSRIMSRPFMRKRSPRPVFADRTALQSNGKRILAGEAHR